MTERLEEIQSRVWKDKGTYAMGDNKSREGYIYTLSDYDYEWLITYAEVGVKLISYITDALISYSEKTGIDLEQLIEKVVDEND